MSAICTVRYVQSVNRLVDGDDLLLKQAELKEQHAKHRQNPWFSLTPPPELAGLVPTAEFQGSIRRLNSILSDRDDSGEDSVFTYATALALACLCCGGYCYLQSQADLPHKAFLRAVEEENTHVWLPKGLRLEVDTYIKTIEERDLAMAPEIRTKQILYHEYSLQVCHAFQSVSGPSQQRKKQQQQQKKKKRKQTASRDQELSLLSAEPHSSTTTAT
jgi:hypothetical protein